MIAINNAGDPSVSLAGTVYICHNLKWGTVCAAGFNAAAANVVCKGFAGYGYRRGVCVCGGGTLVFFLL